MEGGFGAPKREKKEEKGEGKGFWRERKMKSNKIKGIK